jgi:hypothetical protein
MDGPQANVAMDGGCTAVSGKLLITEIIATDVRRVVYDRPAGGVPF